jgi:hypothetical protein
MSHTYSDASLVTIEISAEPQHGQVFGRRDEARFASKTTTTKPPPPRSGGLAVALSLRQAPTTPFAAGSGSRLEAGDPIVTPSYA